MRHSQEEERLKDPISSSDLPQVNVKYLYLSDVTDRLFLCLGNSHCLVEWIYLERSSLTDYANLASSSKEKMLLSCCRLNGESFKDPQRKLEVESTDQRIKGLQQTVTFMILRVGTHS